MSRNVEMTEVDWPKPKPRPHLLTVSWYPERLPYVYIQPNGFDTPATTEGFLTAESLRTLSQMIGNCPVPFARTSYGMTMIEFRMEAQHG